MHVILSFYMKANYTKSYREGSAYHTSGIWNKEGSAYHISGIQNKEGWEYHISGIWKKTIQDHTRRGEHWAYHIRSWKLAIVNSIYAYRMNLSMHLSQIYPFDPQLSFLRISGSSTGVLFYYKKSFFWKVILNLQFFFAEFL